MSKCKDAWWEQIEAQEAFDLALPHVEPAQKEFNFNSVNELLGYDIKKKVDFISKECSINYDDEIPF